MSWVTLGDALEAALVSMMDDGEGTVGAVPDAENGPVRTGAVASPGPVPTNVGVHLPTQINDADRCGPAGNKRARPTLAAGQHLFVIEGGGGRRQGEGRTSAAYRADAGEGSRARELKLRLV